MARRISNAIALALCCVSCAHVASISPEPAEPTVDVVSPKEIGIETASALSPEAQVERLLLTVLAVVADSEVQAHQSDFEHMTTLSFGAWLTENLNGAKANGYAYEDLDGVDLKFKPVEFPAVLAVSEKEAEFAQGTKLSVAGCYLDNGRNVDEENIYNPAPPVLTGIEADVELVGDEWRVASLQHVVFEPGPPDWCDL